jgi:hypothetical protein
MPVKEPTSKLELRGGRAKHVVEAGFLSIVVDVERAIESGLTRADVAAYVDEILRVATTRWKERRGK